MSLKLRQNSPRRTLSSFLLLALLMLPLLPPPRSTQAASSTRASVKHDNGLLDAEAQGRAKANAQEVYANTGLSFEANEGQTDEQVRFLARGAGYTLFLTANEAVFALRSSVCESQSQAPATLSQKSAALSSESSSQSATCDRQSSVLRMRLEGASKQAEAVGADKLPGVSTTSSATTRRSGTRKSRPSRASATARSIRALIWFTTANRVSLSTTSL